LNHSFASRKARSTIGVCPCFRLTAVSAAASFADGAAGFAVQLPADRLLARADKENLVWHG
jgi:hypothetical protein